MADTKTEIPTVEAVPAVVEKIAAGDKAESIAKDDAPATESATVSDEAPAAAPVSEKAEIAAPAEDDKRPAPEAAAVADEPKAASVAEDDKKPEEPSTEAAASAPAPAPAPVPAPTKTAFEEFDAKLPDILKAVGHQEMWGVELVSPAAAHVPTSIVIQKFLNANDGALAPALAQFTKALQYRQEKKPLELVAQTFSAHKFADLGAVTVYPVKDSVVPEVFTWNLYGNVKGRMDEVFVPLADFMDYRIALQELGIQQLGLASATEPITADRDPYKINQVHDYKSISFLRQNPNVKAATDEVIKKFALAYPELLKEKFFLNIPAIMGWMYAVVKMFIAPKTAKKFHPMANGANLAGELGASGVDVSLLPKEYGGTAGAGDGKMKDVPGLVEDLRFA